MKTIDMTDIPNITNRKAVFIIQGENVRYTFESEDYSVDRCFSEKQIQIVIHEKDLRPFFNPGAEEVFSITEITEKEEYFYPAMRAKPVDFYSTRYCDKRSCSMLRFISDQSSI